MAESFVRLPADDAGKKLRTRDRILTAASGAVHEQAVFIGAAETWYGLALDVACIQNRHHLSLMNLAGSGKVIKIRKLFAINAHQGAITGVLTRYEIKQITAATGGRLLTTTGSASGGLSSADSSNAVLPAQIELRFAPASVTEGNVLFPMVTTNEEQAATAGLTNNVFQQYMNLFPEGNEVQDYTLREGQGVSVK